MRLDSVGLFWEDVSTKRVAKEKIVRTPPDPFWLAPDYLPHLAEARAHKFETLSDAELIAAVKAKDLFVWDTEFYPNYVLVGAKHKKSGKLVYWELHDNETLEGKQADKCRWLFQNGAFTGFNSAEFDIPMLMAVLAGLTPARLMRCVNELIFEKPRLYQFYRGIKVDPFHVNDIDLIALTPLGPSLKICAGRIHAKRMADLPFKVGSNLSPDQKLILKWYWTNDLENTSQLYDTHETAIKLREALGREYKVDVRSCSDPQVAEEIIRAEYRRMTGRQRHRKADIVPGRKFFFKVPNYIKFKTEKMQRTLAMIAWQQFEIDGYGGPLMPEELGGLDIVIGDNVYRMGMGGLHSKEKKMIYASDEAYQLSDHDVTSYYPMLIIKQGMYPPNVGPQFLQIFIRLVDKRIASKRAGDKEGAETLKIVINGTFGKTGERGGHSIVYYPEMMIQTTISGQLSLLMLIESLELAGIKVVSANTDGIMVYCPRNKLALRDEIMTTWQKETGLELEHKNYKAVYSRDVNNYIAIYDEPDKKEKNPAYQYAKAIGEYRKVIDAYPPKWNPTCQVCSEAVIRYLATGEALEDTILREKDFRKFVEVRRVTGGAVKNNEFLGKAIRWYYAQGEEHEIVNAKNGYTVPRSQGARPCMTMLSELPDDLDRLYYIERAKSMLVDLNVIDKGADPL